MFKVVLLLLFIFTEQAHSSCWSRIKDIFISGRRETEAKTKYHLASRRWGNAQRSAKFQTQERDFHVVHVAEWNFYLDRIRAIPWPNNYESFFSNWFKNPAFTGLSALERNWLQIKTEGLILQRRADELHLNWLKKDAEWAEARYQYTLQARGFDDLDVLVREGKLTEEMMNDDFYKLYADRIKKRKEFVEAEVAYDLTNKELLRILMIFPSLKESNERPYTTAFYPEFIADYNRIHKEIHLFELNDNDNPISGGLEDNLQ